MAVAVAQIIDAKLAFAEGLAWSARTNSLFVSAVQGGVLYTLDSDLRLRQLADVGGGANNIALADDGSVIVAQNGGIDASGPLSAIFPDISLPPVRHSLPGLQCVSPTGAVTLIAGAGLHAPNDLAVHPDGSVYFTDPGRPEQAGRGVGRIMRRAPDGAVSVVVSGLAYPNGLQIDSTGSLFVTEGRGLLRITPDGERVWIVETLTDHGGDGHCIDVQGRHYVAMMLHAGVQVFDASGNAEEFIEFPGGRLTTNCCFGGTELDWLFMSDGATGSLAVVRDRPVPGQSLPLAQL
jgi:gluconolactonase